MNNWIQAAYMHEKCQSGTCVCGDHNEFARHGNNNAKTGDMTSSLYEGYRQSIGKNSPEAVRFQKNITGATKNLKKVLSTSL